MKTLTCEMCGSTNLIKQDGVFVCQQCGTKYSVEEAKKMMVEGTVSIKGAVKVDNSEEITNLLIAARRAKITGNYESAAKYYDQVTMKDPNNWESYFNSIYCNVTNCKIGDIAISCDMIIKSFNPTLSLIKDNSEESAQKEIVRSILSDLELLTTRYSTANDSFRSTLTLEQKFGTHNYDIDIAEILPTFKKACIEILGPTFEEVAEPSSPQKDKMSNDAVGCGCAASIVSIVLGIVAFIISLNDAHNSVAHYVSLALLTGGVYGIIYLVGQLASQSNKKTLDTNGKE